jgi:hypothetical protein
MATQNVTLTPEQYQVFLTLMKEKEQRDAMIITSAKGNLTVKSNAFGAKGRVFLQPVRYSNGQTFVRTGGNIPASFHVEQTTNRLVCVLQTEPLAPKDIEYWHSQFTNRPGAVNIQSLQSTPQQTFAPQSTASAPYVPAPSQIATPTPSSVPSETEDNPSADTIKKAKKYVDAGAYPDLETAIREVLKTKKK